MPKNSGFVLDRSVPQGSPLSPSLYNLFMDEFGEMVSAIPRYVADFPAELFADGVLVTAKTSTGLQALLDIASKWTNDRRMIWNTKKVKSTSNKASDVRALRKAS